MRRCCSGRSQATSTRWLMSGGFVTGQEHGIQQSASILNSTASCWVQWVGTLTFNAIVFKESCCLLICFSGWLQCPVFHAGTGDNFMASGFSAWAIDCNVDFFLQLNARFLGCLVLVWTGFFSLSTFFYAVTFSNFCLFRENCLSSVLHIFSGSDVRFWEVSDLSWWISIQYWCEHYQPLPELQNSFSLSLSSLYCIIICCSFIHFMSKISSVIILILFYAELFKKWQEITSSSWPLQGN